MRTYTFDRSIKYRCIEERFTDKFPIGLCGKEMSLIEWLEILYNGDMDTESLLDVFQFDTNDEVCDYIADVAGKKLIRVKLKQE